ncbi:MAG TPA: M42 family metallopeptidase [Candidatus Sabulitectum sp.]|nr:M42 family metallopeptidase [Candidatus Sabulitectum sp.]HPJ27692.1 M42 family metallopeptidase [Candidatus Sabulitectum sp.]HPR22802.1 M42 family metallopeptidase [Candidatus Sabulitectum sp.]
MQNTMEFFMQLLRTRSVTGNTYLAVEIVRSRLESLGVPVKQTNKGSLIATLEGTTDDSAVISAHLDTLGAVVSRIESRGILRYKCVGGFTPGSIEGEYCLVETFSGKMIPGTILFDRTSVHAYGREKAQAARTHEEMYVRIDEKVSSREEAESLGISVGNYIHFDPRAQHLDSGFVKGRHIDDKAGVTVLVGVIENLVRQKVKPQRNIHFLFTVHEEVGHGAAGWLPEGVSDFLAVDMGVCGPEQTSQEEKVTICAADSSGPYNYELTRHLINLAEINGIPHVVDTFPFYGSDAGAALRMGLDARHALVGPGVDTSHAIERTHQDGIRATMDLVTLFAME